MRGALHCKHAGAECAARGACSQGRAGPSPLCACPSGPDLSLVALPTLPALRRYVKAHTPPFASYLKGRGEYDPLGDLMSCTLVGGPRCSAFFWKGLSQAAREGSTPGCLPTPSALRLSLCMPKDPCSCLTSCCCAALRCARRRQVMSELFAALAGAPFDMLAFVHMAGSMAERQVGALASLLLNLPACPSVFICLAQPVGAALHSMEQRMGRSQLLSASSIFTQ